MKYSKATNYALHTMVHLALVPGGKAVGVDYLAQEQKVSPTYLSKILTKLVKAGLIESTPGVNGGYRLIKQVEDISFLDVIQAIEGTTTLFSCSSLDHEPLPFHKGCYIQKVMLESEGKMKSELKNRKISEVVEAAKEDKK
ncbi:putative transcriptional regulator [Bacillus sp. TS-2]|nr:putative transcriptional regulator [Bacillus sp. TS-2]